MSALTILEGSTFCICDEIGDIGGVTGGFYAHDTRFLSRLELRLNGTAPLLLSSGRVEYFSAAFYLRNRPDSTLPQDAVSIARERFVGNGMQDHVVLQNETMRPLTLQLALEVAADFADIITVKAHDFSLGDPLHAPALPAPATARYDATANQIVLEETAGSARTQVLLSRPGEVDGGRVVWTVELEPHERWDVRMDVLPSLSGEETQRQVAEQRFGQERRRIGDSLSVWSLRVPQLRSTWDALRHTFDHSVADLAALRMRGEDDSHLPAAGMPWFMAIFGRDTIITSLQTLLFGPELAAGALRALADLQARVDDPSIDAEPGKIVHEVREGRAAETWFARYYGSVDATPLYLVLLSEVWRWTGDDILVQRLRDAAYAALGWIDDYGDRDGDGFVEYGRRTEGGLINQTWKDSGDSQRFHDGRSAEAPIAAAEVQGYVYDAKLRAAELAREVWRDRALAARLEQDAAELKRRFDEAFWVDERGGFYALALDARKQRVDSRCSNMGHLLWSGIVPDERVDDVVDQLFADPLWSGWGIRTMASDDAGYSPLAYHNGTVWPHDNSIAAWGLMRHGRWDEARRIARCLFQAAGHFDWSLPEVFAGYSRTDTPFPIAYPTAARPQAWAAGAPVLLLRILLGLEPDRSSYRLRSVLDDDVPSWVGELRLTGVRAFGRLWDVYLQRGRVRVEEV
ncbi:MAG TPA: glycogen debranching N-terminal domain-containing protein [Gaiellaceae bacterium]|nr:glycogen debranching N-terminal domain-containing protein [Gaiellaceae bacterium]